MAKDITGRYYEEFVARLQQAILRSEGITTHKNIEVEVNKKLIDRFGIRRQFDVYWEYELGGIKYKTIIECRDHDRSVGIGQIDELVNKVSDCPGIKPIVASSNGYQSGARTKADSHGVELLIVREHNDSDFDAIDGLARIRKLVIQVVLQPPPHLSGIRPIVDAAWVKENTPLDPETMDTNIDDNTDRIFIENENDGTRRSLFEIEQSLTPVGERKYGKFTKTVEEKNEFLVYKGNRLKMVRYDLDYHISEPIRQKIEYDIAKEIVGVIEYLQQGKKKTILRDGTIWDE